jgi:hypothetical protein
MVAALYDANNVVVGHAVGYLAPWVAAGATNEGFKVNVDVSTTTITIEEQATPVAEQVESKNMTFEAALVEDTMDTIRLSWGGGTIVSAAATPTTPGTQKMTLSDQTLYYTWAMEMRNFRGFARRIYVPKVSITGSGDVNFRRAADKRAYPMRVVSLCKPSEIQIVDITAPRTA